MTVRVVHEVAVGGVLYPVRVWPAGGGWCADCPWFAFVVAGASPEEVLAFAADRVGRITRVIEESTA